MPRFLAIGSKLSGSRLARDTATATIGQVLRLVLQAVYFVLLGRTFAPAEYGAFIAMTSMVAIVATFAGLGAPNILVKNVTRDRSLLSVYWGNGLLITGVSSVLLTLVMLITGELVLPAGLERSLLLICVADLAFARVAELASFAFIAIGNMFQSALINVSISLCRLIAIAILAVADRHPSVDDWALAYCVGSFVTFVYAFARLVLDARKIRFELGRMRGELVEGTYFALSVSVATVYNDIDKTMLARLSNMTATGIYGVAYRLLDVVMAPVRALAAACYPEFFRRGQDGARATVLYAHTQIKRTVLYGAAIFIGLNFAAPLFPLLVGKAYQPSVGAIRWLAVIPLLRCIHIFLADALVGAGYLRARIAVQMSVAAINVGLNIPFILRWSWRGAAWTSVMCDALLVVAMWTVTRLVTRNEASVRAAA
jgi:O-antigen/teichoic acid export membrane protein